MSYRIKTNSVFAVLLISTLFVQTGCKKDWLNAKSDISLVIPSTINDLQSLLDNTNSVFNVTNATLGEIGADNYYLEYANYQNLDNLLRNSYTWQPNILESTSLLSDWFNPYEQVYYSNTVLEAIVKAGKNSTNEIEWNNVKGSALFYRAFSYYDMAQIFAKPYTRTTAGEDMGLLLRLDTDIKKPLQRATVQKTYDQVIADLTEAIRLLPVTPKYKSRPSKPAAYGLLARVYLSMEEYETARFYADSCIQLYNTLIDYNNLNSASSLPVPRYNEEVIFHNSMTAYQVFFPRISLVDTILYRSYAEGDLRKSIFFDSTSGRVTWKGNYSGSSVSGFDGVATDEVYLIRAETNARSGKTDAAMNDLNTLLAARWKSGEFTPLNADNAEDALISILTERRKELLFRGLRWTDLRRLNKDPRFATTLTRQLNGEVYTLPPNDNRYVYPIPNDEIRYSGIPQNPR